MLETLAGVVRRRHRNALLAPDDTPDARVDTIYNETRRALIRTYTHTRRRALDEEKAIRLRIPGWQPSPGEGPVAEWETEWLASGFFSSEGECELPETLESVRGVAVNGCAVSTVALLCVAPQGEGVACRVKLRLMVEAPGVVLRPQQQLTEQAQRRPPDWVAYTDGSEDLGKAGWAYAVLIGGDAIGDEGASLTSEGYGPVVTSAAHPAYLGARKHTNNTAELTALAELLRALLSSSPQQAGSRGVVRTDSEYAAACMMGRVTPKTNRQLAERLRSLWRRLRAKHTVTWRHVAGHSGNKWNDYVDELAARGRRGDRGSNAAEWADDTIPTDTPDEESNAEGSDSSSSGHGATGSAQDSERNDDSDADCGAATPTATAPASPDSHPSPATDPKTAPVANPRRSPRVRTIWSEYVPSEQAREIGDNRGARCVLALDVDPPPPPLSPDDAALASAMVSLSIHNTLAELATRVDSIALSDEPAPAPRGGGPRPPGGAFGAPPGGEPSGEAGFPRAGSPQPTPPAARAAGHIERFVRVAHPSQPGTADWFCAPTAGDAVLPLS